MFVTIMLILALLSIGLFVIAFRGNKRLNATMDNLANRVAIGKQIARFSGDARYLGGHPSHTLTGNVILSMRERGFVMTAGGRASAAHYSDVKDVTLMSQEQVHKDVTLTRLLTLGVFALAAKKTTVTHQNYIRVVLDVQGVESSFLIESQQAGQIASIMNRGRILANSQAE